MTTKSTIDAALEPRSPSARYAVPARIRRGPASGSAPLGWAGSMGSMGTEASFYTIADAGFFPGLVALLNSLRLTGNTGELVALDRGLTTAQRRLLEGHVSLVELPEAPAGSPILLKPYPGQVGASGTIVLIDSDMVVTRSLDEIAALAARRADLRLSRPQAAPRPLVRRVGAGAGAARSPAAADVPERGLSRALDRALARPARPLVGALRPGSARRSISRRFEQPFWAGDQDVLNAILASEIPEEALAELPEDGEAYPDDLLETVIVDERTLHCDSAGTRPRSSTTRSAPRPGSARPGSASATTPTCGSCRGSSSRTTSPSGWSRARCRSGSGRASGARVSSAAPTSLTAESGAPCTPCLGPVRERALALRNAVFRRL